MRACCDRSHCRTPMARTAKMAKRKLPRSRQDEPKYQPVPRRRRHWSRLSVRLRSDEWPLSAHSAISASSLFTIQTTNHLTRAAFKQSPNRAIKEWVRGASIRTEEAADERHEPHN